MRLGVLTWGAPGTVPSLVFTIVTILPDFNDADGMFSSLIITMSFNKMSGICSFFGGVYGFHVVQLGIHSTIVSKIDL